MVGIMSLSNFDFKKFIEEMDPTMQKNMANSKSEDDAPIDFFAAFGDEAGIEWSDLKKIMQSEPFIATHFSLGSPEILYKTIPWEIVPGSMTPDGAYIRLKHMPGLRSFLKGRRLNKSNYSDKNQYYLKRKDLLRLFNREQGSAGPMGGAGASPPMMI